MNNHIEQIIRETADKIKSHGFKVMLSKTREYGYFTDETGARVCSFQYHLGGGVSFSGNYKSEGNGTGWGIAEYMPSQLTEERLRGLLYVNSPWTFIHYTTEAQHLKMYQQSSKFEEA